MNNIKLEIMLLLICTFPYIGYYFIRKEAKEEAKEVNEFLYGYKKINWVKNIRTIWTIILIYSIVPIIMSLRLIDKIIGELYY